MENNNNTFGVNNKYFTELVKCYEEAKNVTHHCINDKDKKFTSNECEKFKNMLIKKCDSKYREDCFFGN